MSSTHRFPLLGVRKTASWPKFNFSSKVRLQPIPPLKLDFTPPWASIPSTSVLTLCLHCMLPNTRRQKSAVSYWRMHLHLAAKPSTSRELCLCSNTGYPHTNARGRITTEEFHDNLNTCWNYLACHSDAFIQG
jgi:hypothetical protein